MAASATITSASTDVMSLVRSELRSDRPRSVCSRSPGRPGGGGGGGGLSRVSGPSGAPGAFGGTAPEDIPSPFLRGREAEHVPDPSQGVDEPGLLGVDLAAHHRDVGLDDAGVAPEVVVPHV